MSDQLSIDSAIEFITETEQFYRDHARELPWRICEPDGGYDPYKILVSEIMLQQTQVDRVKPKYSAFIERFPALSSLSSATFADVLELWSGLGYSRRARYLFDAAKYLQNQTFPKTIEELVAFKGIGENTAAAILTYSFNQKHIFVETNIRTVFLYYFFPDQDEVSDTEIIEILSQVIEQVTDFREFYWALMDYGSWLKKQGIRNNAQSKHYRKQSKFEGSIRQLRGEVLRRSQIGQSLSTMKKELKDDRLIGVITSLEKEGLIVRQKDKINIAIS